MRHQSTCICVNLRRAARAVSNLYDEALADSGIKITQFSLLRAVQRTEPVAVSVLAGEMELDRTTLARNLLPLERDGLIVLASGSDQRVTEVRSTAAGRAAVARALPMWEAAQLKIGRLLARGRIVELAEIAMETAAAAAKLQATAGHASPQSDSAPRRRSRR
jgi:DNA-binding MarR family transcriptional regulator